MTFTNPFNNLTIPSGAGAGQTRIVIGNELPPPLDTYLVYNLYHYKAAIIMYNDDVSDDSYAYIGLYNSIGGIGFDLGSVSNGAIVERNAGLGTNTPASLNYNVYNAAGVDHATLQLQANLIDSQFSAWQPIHALGPGTQDTPDNWNSPGLSFGWTGALKYQKVASPPDGVQIIAQLTMGATKANGTIITNIGAGWRPATRQDIPGACNNVVAGGESPHLSIEPNGNVTCWGYTAATVGAAQGIISTSF